MVSWLFATALTLAPGQDAPPAPETAPIATEVVFADAPPRPEDVLAIPDELRDMLRQQVIEPAANNRKRRLDLLFDFLFYELGMQYDRDVTHTVAESFHTRKANCLAFTLLTVALAREAGLQAQGQELERVLSWDLNGDIVVQNTHANARIGLYGQHYVIDIAADQVLTHSPPQQIDDDRLLAMYYNNRAMELLMLERPDAADAWLQVAARLDPGYATVWNNMGVLRLRSGDVRAAETHFLHALRINREHTGALSNLVGLYQRIGDGARAAQWRQRADDRLADDPFHQFAQGLRSEQRGDFADALKRYRRAAQLDRDEHVFHFALARAWMRLGDAGRAGAELARARDLSQGDYRGRYQTKLDALRRIQQIQ